MLKQALSLAICLGSGAGLAAADDLAARPPAAETRWATFENPQAARGAGGKENRGAKGHPYDSIPAGATKTLLDVQGAGEIRRMWFTVRERDPEMLRSLKFEMYWDGAAQPAVAVPFGDFFGAILGRTGPFENELFSNPEGRSFNCYIPMPFRKGAKVTITNQSTRDVPYLFYDIDFLLTAKPDPGRLYFHAVWHREARTTLRKDFEILPEVKGEGRFLGTHVGVITDPANTGWWGEGEVKMYLDGDGKLPTIVGTGTEDYIGTGWGQGTFVNRFQGCLVSDSKRGEYTFYRYHVPDPVYFHTGIRVTIQQMGGDTKEHVIAMQQKGADIQPVTMDHDGKTVKLLEAPQPVDLQKQPASGSSWVNIYRRDDWSAVAFFYLDGPENGVAPLAGVRERTAAVDGK
jgi:hypothetical protein